ncbi:probable 6-phosphofructokinase, partial [Nitrobacter sp. Nb-311A]|uniref:6-phosphofructokinase n=1 Tax=Nitrobacter sp. Nb-311A TaxID=314253 RepID=UPI0000685278
RTIDRRGGTVLHSSRTNPSKMKKLPDHLVGPDRPLTKHTNGDTETWDLTDQVLANLSGLGIEHLIAIGGDDTLSYAARLNERGVKVITIPKTMDNDVRNTEYCIGFSTALAGIVLRIWSPETITRLFVVFLVLVRPCPTHRRTNQHTRNSRGASWTN